MNQKITLSQYRTIDLTILAAVLALCQSLIYLASSRWFPEQLYVVSPVAAMTALVLMRWSAYAGIHAALGGVLFVALSGGSWRHFLIYGIGNLLSLAVLPVLRGGGKEKIRADALRTIVFALAVQLLMQLGRAAMAALLGFGWNGCLGFITTDLLSELFTAFVVWIVRRIDGLFEDQKHYLLRIQSEQTR
ncbi:MAG: hypothetical protein ACI4PL_02115 [Faecousia sp.]